MNDSTRRAGRAMAARRIAAGEHPDDAENQIVRWLLCSGLRHHDASRAAADCVREALADRDGCSGAVPW